MAVIDFDQWSSFVWCLTMAVDTEDIVAMTRHRLGGSTEQSLLALPISSIYL